MLYNENLIYGILLFISTYMTSFNALKKQNGGSCYFSYKLKVLNLIKYKY